MKVILTHEVSSLGTAGDVVDVKDGYARNFLFRRGLATAWTKGGQKQVDSINKGREVRAINSLEERGLSVPGDVAVVGFDDSPYATRGKVGLTTVAQPAQEMGVVMADTLLRLLAGESPPRVTTLDTELVVRDSS